MASMTPMKNMRQYPDTFSQGRETQDGASLLSHIAAEDDYDNLFEYSNLFANILRLFPICISILFFPTILFPLSRILISSERYLNC